MEGQPVTKTHHGAAPSSLLFSPFSVSQDTQGIAGHAGGSPTSSVGAHRPLHLPQPSGRLCSAGPAGAHGAWVVFVAGASAGLGAASAELRL